jgi:ribosomal protein L4
MYLNVFDIMNADQIVITADALKIVEEWLKPVAKTTKEAK